MNALTRVQSETLDTLKEGVAVFGSDGRLKLHNRAFSELWELPHDLTSQHPHIDAVIRACRLLAPQDEPWVDLRGAVAGLADLAWEWIAVSTGATARCSNAPPSLFPTAQPC